MNSLRWGVWDRVCVPRSRALGGKSGISRAEPLRRSAPPHLTKSVLPLLLLAAVLAVSGFWGGPPVSNLPLLVLSQISLCAEADASNEQAPLSDKAPSKAKSARVSAQPVPLATARLGFCVRSEPASAPQNLRADAPVTRHIDSFSGTDKVSLKVNM